MTPVTTSRDNASTKDATESRENGSLYAGHVRESTMATLPVILPGRRGIGYSEWRLVRCSTWSRQTLTDRNEVSPSRHWLSCWIRWVTATRMLAHGDARVGEADIGVVDQVADDGGVVVRCHDRYSLFVLIQRSGPTRSGPSGSE